MAAYPFTVVVSLAASAMLATAQAPPASWKEVQSFTIRNCSGCHNSKVTSGNVDLQRLASALDSSEDRDAW